MVPSCRVVDENLVSRDILEYADAQQRDGLGFVVCGMQDVNSRKAFGGKMPTSKPRRPDNPIYPLHGGPWRFIAGFSG